MKKKVTVKDVAREAGVSVATVSYIINNRKDQKISEATRKKVLQIANLLNYRPNHAAVSLATGKTNVIGLAYTLCADTPSRNMEINSFVNMLIERMNRMHYDILFLPVTDDEDSIITNRNLDAIIAVGLTHKQFISFSGKYFVPIITVDMIVNDKLFYQIYTDYPALIAQAEKQLGADSYLLIDKFENEELLRFITDAVSPDRLLIMSDMTEEAKCTLTDKKLIVVGSLLALMIQPYVKSENLFVISSEESEMLLQKNILSIYNNADKKANLTMNILLNVLNHNFDLDHDCKVRQ